MILFPQSTVRRWSEESTQGSTLGLGQRKEGGFSKSLLSEEPVSDSGKFSIIGDAQRQGCHRRN